ncbi:MAG: sn-glycerol-3-phosphate ABC transporter ATP-binding protein UgpC [Betaproteobacteria bacterium]|nr:sn-glycerol-3-phosphate ABC transporter ATP-binding protein UgpC [Betaproteobacteria bacterium]
MAKLVIKDLNKVYDNKVEVLKNVNIEAGHGEFLVLVGPSGCGKSTLLRMIAGLEDISSGAIEIGDRVVNELAPAERDIAMVFQDYALYPHMTVRENLSFGLRIKKRPQEEIDERIQTASKMLNIDHLLDRKPSQLSGGQRQRVAIGRAIVRKPALFLFDEPLSNLDAQLRSQTRIELAALHQKVGATVVYVTHDQVEAMTLADRIAVLNKGKVQQLGSPLDLYNTPVNTFVASFIGNPSMNFFKGNLEISGGQKIFSFNGLKFDFSDAPTPKKSGTYTLGLRPEALKVLAKEGREAEGKIDCKPEVLLIEPHGHETHLVANIAGQQVIIRSANPKRLQVMEAASRGSVLATTIDRKVMHWFDSTEEGGRVNEIS